MIVELEDAVTLIGGGPIVAELLTLARAVAPRIVAADGGADARSWWRICSVTW